MSELMTTELRCPYVGLVPFEPEQSRFFFGRERETRVVVNNLVASRLTLLYGPSGVGKSSLLRAGAMARLARETAEGERPERVVVYLKQWEGAVKARFHEAVAGAVREALPEAEVPAFEGMRMAAWLGAVAEEQGVELLLLFDQFEEFFLYHSEAAAAGKAFARELAAAIKTRGLAAHFLLGLRDDALARLDRFKVLIPNLFANYLRLEPLSEEAAASAIREPVAVLNAESGAAVEVEDELVAAVLTQVRRSVVGAGVGGEGRTEGMEAGIEAPYLQLVMTRVWEEEQRAESSRLRASTFLDAEKLGGAKMIVREHLDRAMAELSDEEQAVCARMFRHLVTPSGAKIAHKASDLAQWAEVPAARTEELLERLAGGAMRILVPVAPADAVGEVRYEIYHDALGEAMLEWQQRWVADDQAAEIAKWRRMVAALVVAMVGALVAFGFAWVQSEKATEQAKRAAESAEEAKTQKEAADRHQQLAETMRRRVATIAQEFQEELDGKVVEVEALIEQGNTTQVQKLLADWRVASAALELDLKTGDLWTDPAVGMRFRFIPPGRFMMGTPEDAVGLFEGETQHEVELTQGYWMAETEVTQGQWQEVMGNNPSHFISCGTDCPVEQVSWWDAVTYSNRLSEKAGLESCYELTDCSGTPGEPGYRCEAIEQLECSGYRLPVEAEWERAARAGAATAYWSGDSESDLGRAGWYRSNSGETTHPGGGKAANVWGLYDVHGNVWEWCWDWYGVYPGALAVDPSGPKVGGYRVLRGGSWFDAARYVRTAFRFSRGPSFRFYYLGFRLARGQPAAESE